VSADIAGFLAALVVEQCALVGALAGVIFLLAPEPPTPRRGAALARATPGLRSAPGQGEPLTAGVMLRLEKLAAEAAPTAAAPAGAPVSGKIDQVSLPRPEARASVLYEPDAVYPAVAWPMVVDGRAEFVGVMVLPKGSEAAAERALGVLALTSAKLEAFLWRREFAREAEAKLTLRESLELLDASQAAGSAESMAQVLCDEVKRRFGAARVSVGLARGDRVRVQAVSDADDIDREGPVAKAIESAMDECAWQDAEVAWPAPAELEQDAASRRVSRAHEELSRRHGPSSVSSLPLRVERDVVGVLTVERPPGDPMPAGGLVLLRLIGEVVGPSLWTRRLADRGFFAVARDRVMEVARVTVGPRYTAAKLVGAALLLALALLAGVPIPARVAAEGEVRAVESRTIVPPFAGYLSSVLVQPSDRVEAGQVLAELDTRELGAQVERTSAERAKLEVQRDVALAERDHSRAKALGADIAALDAQIRLHERMIEQAVVRSPIAGVVGRGDLRQFVGARVDPEQSLLEIVTDKRHVVLQVDERRIGRVRVGQEGWFASKAEPERAAPIRVTRVTPVSEVVRERNVFAVEAELTGQGPAGELRPGMSGVARLRDGWTTGLSRLAGPLVDELRLRLWF
jgi:multidrug efflux pump subunit AcrA (membrane-fusion protein)